MKSKDAHVTNKMSLSTHSQGTPMQKCPKSDNKENKLGANRKETTKQKADGRAPSTKSVRGKGDKSNKNNCKSGRKRRHSDTIDAHNAKHSQLGQPEEKKRDNSKGTVENINRKLRKCKKLVVVLERFDISKEKMQSTITDAESRIMAEADNETVGKMLPVIDEIPIAKEYNNLVEDPESLSDKSFPTALYPPNTITEASTQEYHVASDEDNLVIDELRLLTLELSDSNGEDGSDKVCEDIVSKIDEIFPDLLEVVKHLPEAGMLDIDDTEILIDIEEVDWSIILGSPPSFENKSAKCVDNNELAISLFKIYEEFFDHEFAFNRNLRKAPSTSRKAANPNFSFEYSVQHQIFSIRFYECLDRHFVQDADVNVFLKQVFVLIEENMCVYAFCLLRLLDSHVCCRTTFAHNFLSKIWKITSLLHYINPKAFEATIYNKCRNKDDAIKLRFLREVDAFNKRKVTRMMVTKSAKCEDTILRELFCGDASFGHPEPLMMFASRLLLTPSRTSNKESDTETIILKPKQINICNSKVSQEVKETSDNERLGLPPTCTITTAAQPVSTGVQKHPQIRVIPLKQLQSGANAIRSQLTPTCDDMPIIAPTYQASVNQSSVELRASVDLPSSLHQLSAFTQNHMRQWYTSSKVTTPQSKTKYQHQTSLPPVLQNPQLYMRESSGFWKAETATIDRRSHIHNFYPEIRAIPTKRWQSGKKDSTSSLIPTPVDMLIAPTWQCSVNLQSVAHEAFAESPLNIPSAHQLTRFTQNHMRQSYQPVKITTPQSTTFREMPITSPMYQVSVHQPQSSLYGPQVHANGQRGPANMPPSTSHNTPTTIDQHQTSLPPVLQNPQVYMRESSGLQNAESTTINRRSDIYNFQSHMCQRQSIIQSSRVQNPSRHPNHIGFPNNINIQQSGNIQNVLSVPNSQTMLHGQYFPVMTSRYQAPMKKEVKKKKVPKTQRGTAPVTFPSKETVPYQSQLGKGFLTELIQLMRDNRDNMLELLNVRTPSSLLLDSKEVIVIGDD